MRKTTPVWVISCLFAVGCFRAPEGRTSIEPMFHSPREVWKIGEAESATVGDIILVEGADVRTANAFQLSKPLAFTLPGTLGISFDCTIDPCILEPQYIARDYVAYVAPLGAGRATYNGRPVFADGDELGIRVHRRNGQFYLYCDNSVFNAGYAVHGFAVWTREATATERAAFTPTTIERMYWAGQARALRYAGSSGGEMRFDYCRYRRNLTDGSLTELESTEYRFDLPSGGTGEIAIRGAVVEILSISPSEVRYRVRSGFSLPSDRESEPPVAPISPEPDTAKSPLTSAFGRSE